MAWRRESAKLRPVWQGAADRRLKDFNASPVALCDAVAEVAGFETQFSRTKLTEVSVKIAVTSQNFRTITGHAGKTRRFLMFCADASGQVEECDRLDLPKEMSMHAFRGDEHPIDQADILITAGCGDGFRRRMAARGIRVVTTSETDPRVAAQAVARGMPLPVAGPPDHGKH